MKHRDTPYRKGLAILCMAALPLALAGCFPSSSSDTTSDGGDDGDNGTPPPPPVEVAFKVDYGLADYVQPQWGDAVTITAFRPGQASYEFLASNTTHTGSNSFTPGGMACSVCHAGNAGNPPQVGAVYDEEDPVPADIETVDITLQAAYDADNFYLKASWDTARPGITHGIYTYRDGAWVVNSTALEPDTVVLEEGQVYAAEDRFGIMFMPAAKDVTVGASFHTAGCFVTCHADMDDMPEWPVDEPDTPKYLLSSGSGAYGSGTATDADVTAGTDDTFPDMWHFRGGRSAAIQTLTDGFVMASRANDDSPNFYATNAAADGGYMYDADWMAAYIEANFPDYAGETNVHAFPADLWDEALQNAPVLVVEGDGLNAVPFDAVTGNFQEGDILPRIRLTPQTGSRTDVMAYSGWENGTWTVVFQRARDTGNPDDHALNPADGYTFAFSVFQEHTQHRWHHVTFPVTLGTEGSAAAIQAHFNN